MHDQNQNNYQPVETYQPQLQPKDKGSRRARFKAWYKKHWKVLTPLTIILLLIIGGGVYALTSGNKTIPIVSVKKKAAPKPVKFYSPLTGVEVTEAETKYPVTGVMLENSPESRPQSGLKQAGTVFESVTEGGITRFMALYQEAQPALIGPVRSVRSQFATWLGGFDASLAHVGGAPEPLAKLRSGKLKDLDQFFNAGTYYRASDRAAPHNVYTTMSRLNELNKAKGFTSSDFTSWVRHTKAVEPAAAPTASTISLQVSSPIFNPSYTWDKASNTYLRSQGGAAHIDREAGQLSPNVVLVMQLQHEAIDGKNGYSYPNANGSGKAWLFQSGTVTELDWSKLNDKTQIVFTDPTNKPVKFNPGQMWITAIRPTITPSWQ